MIETDEQRRWWFATHPEYSWSHKGGRDREEEGGGDEGAGEGQDDKVRPEDVDAYVDNALKYVDGPVADLLKSVKRNFGTEGEIKGGQQQALIAGRDTDARAGGKSGNDAGGTAEPWNKDPLTYDQGYKDGMNWALEPNRGPGPPRVLKPEYLNGFSDGVTEVWKQAQARSETWDRLSQAASDTWDTLTSWLPFGGGTRWKTGEDHLSPTSKGTEPSWTTQYNRYWKNEAANESAIEKWGAENVERMKRGTAPQRRNPRTGEMESRELHHTPDPQRHGGKEFIEMWPDEHARIDPQRRLKKR